MSEQAASQSPSEVTPAAGSVAEARSQHKRIPMKRCVKCGKWKYVDPDKSVGEFIYYPTRDSYSLWCKVCYGQASSVGKRMAAMRKRGDQAGALLPGEGELQRTVRRGDKLMSVAEWCAKGVGALALLGGEAIYQFDQREDGLYVRILRRAPLNPLTPVALDTFIWARGTEEGVFYQ